MSGLHQHSRKTQSISGEKQSQSKRNQSNSEGSEGKDGNDMHNDQLLA